MFTTTTNNNAKYLQSAIYAAMIHNDKQGQDGTPNSKVCKFFEPDLLADSCIPCHKIKSIKAL